MCCFQIQDVNHCTFWNIRHSENSREYISHFVRYWIYMRLYTNKCVPEEIERKTHMHAYKLHLSHMHIGMQNKILVHILNWRITDTLTSIHGEYHEHIKQDGRILNQLHVYITCDIFILTKTYILMQWHISTKWCRMYVKCVYMPYWYVDSLCCIQRKIYIYTSNLHTYMKVCTLLCFYTGMHWVFSLYPP